MALPITLLFLIFSMLSPADLIPELYPMRPMLVLTVIAILASMMAAFQDFRSLMVPQLAILVALYGMLSVSRVLNGWYGGAFESILSFSSQFFTFVLVMLSANSSRKIRWIGGAILFVSFYYIARGWLALALGFDLDKFAIEQWAGVDLLSGQKILMLRTKGLGYLDDPNDLAQFYLASLPFLWISLRKGRIGRNLFMVYLPTAVVILGLYQTASRGSLVGLTMLLAVALKRKFGVGGPIISVAFALFLVLVAGYGGGRVYSATEDSGGGGVEIWSEAMGVLRGSPIWGIGYGMLSRHMQLTAHNSFVLCLTELGLVGASIWLALIVTSVLQLRRVAALPTDNPEVESVVRLARTLQLSLVGWGTTAYFLSSCYSVTFYVYMGLSAAVWLEARRRAPELAVVTLGRIMRFTFVALVGCLAVVYTLIRIRWAG